MIKYQVINTKISANFEPRVEWIKKVINQYGFTVGDIIYVFCDDELYYKVLVYGVKLGFCMCES